MDNRCQIIDLVERCRTLELAHRLHLQAVEKSSKLIEDVFLSNKLIEMYGRCSNVQHARQVFDGIRSKDFHSWNIMIYAYSRNGHLDEAAFIFEAAPKKNLVTWNSMLTAYAQNGHLLRALDLFQRMPYLNVISWTAMLAAYSQVGYLEQAKQLFDRMPQRNLITWNAMLAAYAQCGDLLMSRKLFERMPEWNLISLNAMLSAITGTSDLIQSKQFFDTMQEKDLVSWTCLLIVYAEKGNVQMARKIFREIPLRSLVTWNAMLSAYSETGSLEDAKSTYDGIPEWDLFSSTSMLVAYSENGEVEQAKELFDSMLERSLVSWNAMLSAYAQNGWVEHGKHIFDRMPEHDPVSSTMLIMAYGQTGYIEESKLLFDEMPHRDALSWSAVLSSYAQNGHIDEAKVVFDNMLERGTFSWSTMLAAYTHNGRAPEALDLFDEMKLTDTPDESCFASVILACSHTGKVFTGRAHFVSMVMDFWIRATKQHYCCMIDMFGRAGRLDYAQELVASMPFVPDALEWRSLLGASRSHSDLHHGACAAKSLNNLDPKDASSYVLLSDIYSMRKASMELVVAIPVFDHLTLIDAAGPYEVLSLVPKVTVVFVSDKPGTIIAGRRSKVGLTATASFEDVPQPDVIVVPGGPASLLPLNHEPLLNWIRQAHRTTLYTTSVCTGTLILAAAGLLEGLEAATHWTANQTLERLGSKVSTSKQRYIQQGKIITAAGASAGIDMALYLSCLLSDEETAKGIQLLIEYDPQPPFECGSLDKAGGGVVTRALEILSNK